jgi:hypothetical protein
MFRIASLAPVCLIVAGCAEITLPDLSAPAAPEVRSTPVQDAACVGAVRQEVLLADVRIETRTALAEDAVSYELAVGRDGTRWACTATAAGATTAVGPLRGPDPAPQMTATTPQPSAPQQAPQPSAPQQAAPAAAPVPAAPAPAAPPVGAARTPAAPSGGPVILREVEGATSGPAVLPAPDPRSLAPTAPLPAFN